MPDMTSSGGAEPQTDSSKKPAGKGRLVVIVTLCVGLAAGGYMIGGRGGAQPTVAEAPAEEPEPEVGEIVDLESVNINLADGHYLRIAVSLGLEAHTEGEEAGTESADHGEATTEDAGPSIAVAPASDLVLSTFAGRTMELLASAEGREAARHDLLEGLRQYYGDDAPVLTVFFTEFVMQ